MTGPPKRKSPASISVERGARHERYSKSQAGLTNKKRKKQEQEPAELAIYGGRRTWKWLGTVREIGPADFAVTATDNSELGSFKTLKAAADALEAHGAIRA